MTGLGGMPITMLNGFGCGPCGGTCLGAVVDYDQITVGGKKYTVNQIIGKNVVAGKETKAFSGNRGTPRVVATIKAGQPIGIVASYARPQQADGRSWLMFESGYNTVYWVPNEAVSDAGLKEQGSKTVSQEIKEEQEAKKRQEDPVGYYIKKYALPALLIIGVIVIVGGVAKESAKAYVTKKA
ncbi:MAG: hypothetical protein ACRC1W_01375 [Shewanella sp.]